VGLKNQLKMSESNFVVSLKKTENGLLLVVTDQELIGNKFVEGRRQLELTNEFYLGEEMDQEKVTSLFSSARHIHLTGKRAIELGINLGFIDGKKVLIIHNIPHAESFIE
jgi:uncharacterized protein